MQPSFNEVRHVLNLAQVLAMRQTQLRLVSFDGDCTLYSDGKDFSDCKLARFITLLMRQGGFDGPMLIDQGTEDQFFDLLRPQALAEAMAARRQDGVLRMQKGYDHSYFFISTFMEDHVTFHAEALYA